MLGPDIWSRRGGGGSFGSEASDGGAGGRRGVKVVVDSIGRFNDVDIVSNGVVVFIILIIVILFVIVFIIFLEILILVVIDVVIVVVVVVAVVAVVVEYYIILKNNYCCCPWIRSPRFVSTEYSLFPKISILFLQNGRTHFVLFGCRLPAFPLTSSKTIENQI